MPTFLSSAVKRLVLTGYLINNANLDRQQGYIDSVFKEILVDSKVSHKVTVIATNM
jgi:hypothetical protein